MAVSVELGKALDKALENATLDEVLASPPSALAGLTEKHAVPAENLLQPDLLRRLCWSPPRPLTGETVTQALAAGGARPWQVEVVGGPVGQVLASLD